MPTPKRGPRLGGGPAQQRAILRNQATELFRHGRIRTTQAKAKLLRPYAEKLITKAKTGDLHRRRQVLSELRDRDVVAYLFEDVAPRYAERNGGYTRLLKLGPRAGDNARMAIVELVEQGAGDSGEDAIQESRGRRSRGLFGRRRRGAGGEAATAVAEPEDVEEIEEPEEDERLGDQARKEQYDPDTASAPDDPAVGNPVDMTGDDADAGGSTGKDAGLS